VTKTQISLGNYKKADTAYIRLNDKFFHQPSKKITEDVLVNFAKNGTVVGIEVLDASRNMPMPISQSQFPSKAFSLRAIKALCLVA
jgi:uncharacterized protein YuzE